MPWEIPQLDDFLCVWAPAEQLESLTPDAGWQVPPWHNRGARSIGHWDFRWKLFREAHHPAPAPCDFRAVDKRLGLFRGLLFRDPSGRAWLDHLLRRDGPEEWLRLLDETSGTFCGIAYDADAERVFVFTDGYAVERIYYGRYRSGWAIGTDPFRLAALCGSWTPSPVALGGILFCGYSPGTAVFDHQELVPAGCGVILAKEGATIREYWSEPEAILRPTDGLRALRDSLVDFWQSPISEAAASGWLLLSGGRDSRVLLRFALEAGKRPRLLTYERRDNSIYPFVTYLLDDTRDREVAMQLAADLGLSIVSLRIPNAHVLCHLAEIVWLNHGGPLHWELHGVGHQLGRGNEPVIVGFEGDGVSTLHKLPGSSDEEQAIRWLHNEGDPEIYRVATDLLQLPLASFDRLCERVRGILALSRSTRRSTQARWAFIRLRGVGRNVPTFQQIRGYRAAIYPYMDRAVRRAYEALPDRELAHRRAHTRLLLGDARFSRHPVSRSGLSVPLEIRLGPLLRRLRRGLQTLTGSRRGDWWGLSGGVRESIERTWRDLGGEARVWDEWVRRCGTRPGFPAMAAHLLELMRIRCAMDQIRESSGAACGNGCRTVHEGVAQTGISIH